MSRNYRVKSLCLNCRGFSHQYEAIVELFYWLTCISNQFYVIGFHKTKSSLSFCVVATTLGTVVAFFLVPMRSLGGDAWKIAAALMGRHIGGGKVLAALLVLAAVSL